MRNTIAAGLLAICINPAISQENWCGFDAQNTRLNQENPGRELTIHEQFLRASHGNSYMVDRTDPIIIPVVVHVIHDGGESNISVEQILSGIDMLNEDFNRLNADTINTRNSAEAPFLPFAADVGIQFMMAKIDPDGNCTNGIERRYNPGMTNNADDNAKHYNQGGLDAWNRNNYMNIWIVNSIESDGEGTTLGYAEFPYSGGSSNYGVIIRHDAYGTVGTASGDRTLSHEIGHCLGLMHTFQGGCHSDDCSDNGDYCCDTPPESEAHWSCMTSLNSCDDVPVNDIYGFDANDQWENFMSYAPCQNMFSEDQKAIIMFNLTDINFLANLTSLANQAETGVLLPEQLCKAEFTSDATVICVGSSVQFFDQSYFNVTGRTWNFSGGSPASSTDQNPVVTYNTPGVYDISLEVTDGSSSVTEIANDYLIVLSDPGEALPHVEGFESFTTFPDNTAYFVQNDNGQDTWEITGETSYTGSQCVWIDNFGENDGSSDAFISGTIDLSTVDPADDMVFTFKYAYKKRTSANDEWLQFSISKDCGQSWSIRKNLHGDQLSEFTQISPYEPWTAEEWTTVNVTNITSDYYTSDFRYKFTFRNDGGNNIYIDHINLYPESMTEISEEENENLLRVFPNPVNNSLTIQKYFNGIVYGTIVIENLTGQKIMEVYNGEMNHGTNEWNLNTSNLPAGIYFVKISTENGIESIKIIKE
ncbi:MAG: T9SS type A sorting domain-containing protein [Crocinitomicaceae bacterium]|nr:T9SS type A sorting domain-containing protein [Crocinitomicaceae bacterium]